MKSVSRWQRGSFRAWVVFAVAWVGAAAWVNYGPRWDSDPKVLLPRFGSACESEPVTGSKAPAFDSSKPYEVLPPLPKGYVLDPRPKDPSGIDDWILPEKPNVAERRKVAECVEEVRAQNWRDVERAEWTIAPPILMLIIGWAVGWVVAGFKDAAR